LEPRTPEPGNPEPGTRPAPPRREASEAGNPGPGAGLLLGLGAAAVLARLMTSLLFGVSPTDPLTYAAVTLGLGLVVLAASWIPARRAARVDPVLALRAEVC